MHIVADTSVLVAVISNEPTKAALVDATRGASLLAPASVHWEIGNAFSAMLKQNRVRLTQIKKAISAYMNIPIRFVDVDLMEALQISNRLNIYAYDAYVLACAQTHRCPVLTLDAGLIRAAKQIGVAILEVEP